MSTYLESGSSNLKVQMAEVATFAGGCFWCIETPFLEIDGVTGVVSGYASTAPNLTSEVIQRYRGSDRYREAVQLSFTPSVISYQQLLDIFWLQIDAADPMGQFYDRGYQHTTAIYFHSQEQQQIAEASKVALDAKGVYDRPVATQIEPFGSFVIADEYHQRFAANNPRRYQMYKRLSGRAGHIAKMEKAIVTDESNQHKKAS